MKRLLFLASLLFSSLVFADQHPVAAVDYGQQRKDLFHKVDFNPLQFEHDERSAIDSSLKLWKEGKTSDALDALYALLDKYPTSLAGNRRVAEAMDAWSEHASTPEHKAVFVTAAKKYRGIYESLIQSILTSGDGKSEATAYSVLDVLEEYELLRNLHLQPQVQSLVNDAVSGKAYDRFTLKNEAGKESVMFFDVTDFLAAENRALTEPPKKTEVKQKSDQETGGPTK